MLRRVWREGWYGPARMIVSPNHGPRPDGVVPWLLVLHSISLPAGEYGGDAIERLFTNRLDPQAHPSFPEIAELRVSAHFVIRRDGALWQFVDCDRRAWHAGRSIWRGVPQCNDHSIGIELEGLEGTTFAAAQYPVLVRLVRALARRYPLREVVGHQHIAPDRKGDPGSGFEWERLVRGLGWPRERFAPWSDGGPGTFPRD